MNQASHPTFEGRFHDIAGAQDIRAMEFLRPDTTDRDQRGQMEDGLGAREGGDQRFLVEKVALDPLDAEIRGRPSTLPKDRTNLDGARTCRPGPASTPPRSARLPR